MESSETIVAFLVVFGFFALPAAAVIWFIVSLVGHIVVKSRRRQDPERYTETQQRAWRRSLIASAIVAAVLVAFCVGIVLLLVQAVAHM